MWSTFGFIHCHDAYPEKRTANTAHYNSYSHNFGHSYGRSGGHFHSRTDSRYDSPKSVVRSEAAEDDKDSVLFPTIPTARSSTNSPNSSSTTKYGNFDDLEQLLTSCVGDNSDKFDVFLSYRVSSDFIHAKYVYELLTARGVRVWWDKKCIAPGEKWRRSFCAGLVNSKTFVCILSNDSINNSCDDTMNFGKLQQESKCDNLLLELRLAIELHKLGIVKKLFPILIGKHSHCGSCSPSSLQTLQLDEIVDELVSRKYDNFFKHGCLPVMTDVVVEAVEHCTQKVVQAIHKQIRMIAKDSANQPITSNFYSNESYDVRKIGKDEHDNETNDLLDSTGVQTDLNSAQNEQDSCEVHVDPMSVSSILAAILSYHGATIEGNGKTSFDLAIDSIENMISNSTLPNSVQNDSKSSSNDDNHEDPQEIANLYRTLLISEQSKSDELSKKIERLQCMMWQLQLENQVLLQENRTLRGMK